MIRRGFTIVELLIVIVVIAILAAISVVAYNGTQHRARSTAFADAILSSDKAFKLQRTGEWSGIWPVRSDNPSFATLISTTQLSNYMQSAPNISGMSGVVWEYDFDNDTYNGCSIGASGPNFLIRNLQNYAEIVQAVDDEIDDGNLSCGKMRYQPTDVNGTVYWSLGRSVNE